MSYGTKYILQFTSNMNEQYQVYFNYKDFTSTNPPLVLTGDDDCVTLRATTGDENKLEPIIGQECLINIYTGELTIDNFTATAFDDIQITVNRMDTDYTETVFNGYVAVDKMTQPFIDPPYVISIRALDGLGLLKGTDLVDQNNVKFFGNFSLIEWIAQILYKVNPTMNIRVYFNWYNTVMFESIGVFEQIYLNSTTFSEGDAFNVNAADPSIDTNANSADDCYTALEKIIRCTRCKIFQQNGVWNIVNLYEYANPDGYAYQEYKYFDVTNGFVGVGISGGYQTGLNYNTPIGKKQITFPVNGDQSLINNQPLKWVQLTYNYDQSQNKVCNQDFTEGTRNTSYDYVISSSIVDPSITPVVNLNVQGYDTYCWTHLNGVITNSVVANPLPSSPPDKKAYIASVVDDLGYVVDRFQVIENSSQPTYIKAASFLIDQNDALVIDLDFRSKGSHTGLVGGPFGWVLLTGTDGSHWALNGIEGPGVASPESNKATWFPVDANFRNTFNVTPAVGWAGLSGNENQWESVATGGYKPSIAPVSGSIEFCIFNFNGSADEFWYKNLSITITPYLQGSYTQLKGDYNYVTSASSISIRQSQDDAVEISDSPKRYFKGALIDFLGNLLPPGLSGSAGGWYLIGQPKTTLYRFTGIMDLLLYNAQYRVFKEIEGTFKGLLYRTGGTAPAFLANGILNSYYFVDTNYPTKRFMCTSFEKHLCTGEFRGVFIEITNDATDNGFMVPSGYPIFGYLFS